MKRKMISLFMSLALILSVLPISAFAESETPFAGQTYILTGPSESLTENTYSGSWGATVGEFGASFGVRFKENETAVPAENISWDNNSLPDGISVGNGGTDYVNVSVAPTVSAGEHTVNMTVNGKSAVIKVNVAASSSGNTGNNSDNFAGQTFIVLGGVEQSNNIYSCNFGTNTSFGVRFKENNEYVTNIAAPSSLPTGVGVSVNENTATVSTNGTTPSGLYNLIFTVNGKNATVQLSINSNGSGETPSSMPILEYATNVAAPNWQPVPTGNGALPMVVNKDEYIYYRITQDGKAIPQANITTNVNNVMGLAAIDESASTADYRAIKGGAVNGYVNISFVYSYNGSNGNTGTGIMIAGNVIVPDFDSDYKNAIIKQSFANSGAVSFANVSGSLTSEDAQKGFALNGGTLSFDTANKAAGVYNATLNGQMYTVAVMNPISYSNINARQVTMSADVPNNLPTGGNKDGIYVWNGMQNGALANQVPFVENQNGQTIPIYLYRQVNNQLVSMENYTFTLTSPAMDIAPFVSFDTVTINGVAVVRLSVSSKAVKTSTIVGFVNINDENGDFVQSVEFLKASGQMQGAYAFTTIPTSVSANSGMAFYNNSATIFVGEGFSGDTQNGDDPSKVYLTKKSGDPVKYDFALYDEIDISTLNVQSSNNDFIKVKGFLEKTPNGENAIGYELEIVDNTKVQSAEILVSYSDKNGNPYTYYGGITCADKTPPAEERTVSTVAEFKSAYNSLTSGKIIMEAGTYSMDLLHNKNIAIVSKDGATVIINGENGTNTNAIITIGLSNSAEISGVIIDGRNKQRDGIDPNNFNGYASGVTIRNCNVGIRQTGTWALVVSNAVFDNNTTAINAIAGRIDIRTSTFVNNGIAINYGAAAPNECRTHLNKFINNTTDFYVNTNYNNIFSTQNYFQGQSDVRKPVIQTADGKTAKVYYSPYYANSEMTVLSADIAGAKTNTVSRTITQNLTIPVDRTLNAASVFDSGIFAEMKQTGNEGIAISIPVTEQTDVVNNTTKVTTIWGFDNEEGNLAEDLPSTMDLQVTDTLSASAQSIVNNSSINASEVVQYVNFAHNGLLPGYATIKIRKTNSISKENLQLYYINETTGKVEQAKIVDVQEETIDGEVYYIVTVDHCSEYVIATASAFEVDDSNGSNDSNDSNSSGTTPDNSTSTTPTTSTTTPTITTNTAKKPVTQPVANNLTSAVEIENKFKNAAAAEVEIDVKAKALLSPKAFGILSEYPDKKLVLKGDGYSWSFSGAEITNSSAIKDASFDTTISLQSPNKDEISKLTGDAEIINIYFSYHGELPGPAKVTIHVGKDQANKTKHLYYYNDATKSLEYLGETVVDENGNIEFTITHCSDYLASDTKFAEEDKAMPNDTADKSENQSAITQPETNTEKPVSIGLIVCIALIAVGMVTIIFAVKRKREQ